MEEKNVLTGEPFVASPGPARRVFNRLGFALFAMAVATVAVQAMLSGYTLVSGRNMNILLITFVPIYLVAFPLALVIMRGAEPEKAAGLPLGAGRFLSLLVMCFPLMYIGNIVSTLLASLLSGGSSSNPLETLVSLSSGLLQAVLFALVAPLLEEFIFRKQLIDRTVRYGEKTAVVFSALSFALFHMNLYQFLYAFALGLLWGYVYVRTRRLRYTAAMHIIVNLLGTVLAPYLLGKAGSLDPEALAAGELDPTALLPMLGLGAYVLLVVALSIAGLVLLIRQRKKLVFVPAEKELDRAERIRSVYLRPGYVLYALVCVGAMILVLVTV